MKGYSVQRNCPTSRGTGVALDRVLDILETVLQSNSDATLAEIASRTCLPKPTAHRILGGLANRGYVSSWRHGHYGPGPQAFVLAGLANAVRDYALIAGPALAELRLHTHDTIHLALLVGKGAVYIEKLEGDRPYHSASKVGLHLPLHCTAIGKAILAELPDPVCEEILRALPLPRRTQRTLTDLSSLREELEVTRARRFAIDDEENEDGIRCVGSAFLDHYGAVVGAVSVSAPVFTLSVADATGLGPEVLKVATTVSRALGAPSAQVRVSLRREEMIGAES